MKSTHSREGPRIWRREGRGKVHQRVAIRSEQPPYLGRKTPAGARHPAGAEELSLYVSALGERHPCPGAVADDDVVVQVHVQESRGVGKLPRQA